jgi:hypothetical protein
MMFQQLTVQLLSLCTVTPTIWTAWTGWYPKKISVHVKRIPIAEVPEDKESLNKFLFKIFEEKDELLDIFQRNGKFPDDKRPSWPPGYISLREF